MPFIQQTPRVFNRQNVSALTTGQVGVYGLYKASQWVYIGRGDIRTRLLAHLDGDIPCIVREAPTHWVDEVTSDDQGREKELLREIPTTCNQRLG